MRKLAFSVLFLFALTARAQNVTVLRAARLFDGTGAAPVAKGVVVVTGKKITDVD